MQNLQDVQLAADTLKTMFPDGFQAQSHAPVGIILGTGLSDSANLILPKCTAIDFHKLPGFPVPGIASHAGKFLTGFAGSLPVLIQAGRFHLYEGRKPDEICMGVRMMAALGCKVIIITNAAGALNPLFRTGSIMCMADIINHTGISPLTGLMYGDPCFPDMSMPFDPDLRSLAANIALKSAITLEQGVYLAVHGPEMETPAETRMYRQWGADAIGMSTALEVIAARHLEMRVLGFSCLTNKNLPDAMKPAPLEEVIANASRTGPILARLISLILMEMSNSCLLGSSQVIQTD